MIGLCNCILRDYDERHEPLDTVPSRCTAALPERHAMNVVITAVEWQRLN